MSGGVIGFKVGDLLIAETPPPPWKAPPGWKAQMGICMDPIPDRDRASHMNILVEGERIYAIPACWRVACREE